MKKNKILVQYIQVDANGDTSMQIRKYNDETKADEFISNLPARGVKKCIKKEELVLVEEGE